MVSIFIFYRVPELLGFTIELQPAVNVSVSGKIHDLCIYGSLNEATEIHFCQEIF